MSRPLAVLRTFATLPGLRKLTRFGPLLRFSFALRAVLVEERARFAANEFRRRSVLGTYRLRGSKISIALRHHTPDVLVLDEIFSQREYDFPPEVRQALDAVKEPLRVVDLGANVGLFGAWVLIHFPRARIVAVEPDPANATVHAATIEANDRHETWSLVRAGAGGSSATARFVAGRFATSHLEPEDERGVLVPVQDVFPHLERADLVKIDVEGGEWAILGDERFRRLTAPVVVLEYHSHLCPGTDPAAEAHGALREAGYTLVQGRHKPAYGAGIVWGWKATG